MSLRFTPMTEGDARAILAWRYKEPYAVYNLPDPAQGGEFEVLTEMLDPRSPHFAVREARQANEQAEAPLIGFFSYGSSCEVGGEETAGVATPYLLRPDGSITIGLGLRPDATGQGRGLELVEAILAFARERYHPSLFRLYVYSWNERALRVYKRAGFTSVGVTRIAPPEGERVFIEMTRPA
jgi:ribosomal-protein-alanine N-acetyltransferase